MNLNLDHILILGAGKTGLSVQKWCMQNKVTCTLWNGDCDDHSNVKMENVTCVVISPGLKPSHPLPKAAKQLGIPVITDIDLFFSKNPTVSNHTFGITGTNGKSTTTALLHHIFYNTNQKGNAFLGGNIGTPILDLPVESVAKYVIELSSYQLELSHRLNLFAAVLLNLTPDHLERHGSMAQYSIDKMKIFDGCQYPVICIDDAYTLDAYNNVKKHHNFVAISCTQKADYYVDDRGMLFIKEAPIASLTDMPLKGKHNWQNILAAFALAHISGLSPDLIVQAMQSFKGLNHRLQTVKKLSNVTFINDSKATNAEATEKAIKAYHDKGLYVILGGRAKEDGLKSLYPLLHHIKKAYLIGEAADNFSEILKAESVPHTISHTLSAALKSAYQDALKVSDENVVLLSPSCASFDQFKNFEERGDLFCQIVNNL
ncbi:MAG: UDP-N-acetylmuramoyl-L-alanine--D-glutamate ligase [Alphaproteobacteria bacterium CG_4_10_14_0_8_um_filter_37_21]|nr:MAG: UDP-N-acetylmuramoyl-L-alanine--D-glutamate ligase [Alphaproteobacteria bacterium CG_4_10_14_0_8_um_filter_37_21]